jgi:hypothetical protein
MISAFGVDHGWVSKGFRPNFLRAAKKVAASTQAAPTKIATEGNSFVLARDTARLYGQSAARSMKNDPGQAAVHQMMGRDAKRTTRRILSESNAYQQNTRRRVLP